MTATTHLSPAQSRLGLYSEASINEVPRHGFRFDRAHEVRPRCNLVEMLRAAVVGGKEVGNLGFGRAGKTGLGDLRDDGMPCRPTSRAYERVGF